MYEQTEWGTGDTITSNKLNKIESGIAGNSASIATLESTLDDYDTAEVLHDADTLLAAGTLIELSKPLSEFDRIEFVYNMPTCATARVQSRVFNIAAAGGWFALDGFYVKADEETKPAHEMYFAYAGIQVQDGLLVTDVAMTQQLSEVGAMSVMADTNNITIKKVIGYRKSANAEMDDARRDADGNYYDTLGQSIRMQLTKAFAEKADVIDMDAVSSRIDKLINKGTVADATSELVDLRIDDEGTVHDTARAAQKAQFDKLKVADATMLEKHYADKELLEQKIAAMDSKMIQIEESSETVAEIVPDKYYVFGEVETLTITLEQAADNYLHEYMFEFSSGTTAAVLTLPETVKWATDSTVDASKTYQVSIMRNVACMIGA